MAPFASLVIGLGLGCFAHAAFPPSPVPQTGQTSCYGTTGTAIVACAGTGQDGETQTGVAWPKPRFVKSGDQMIGDRLTGLVWTENANPTGGPKTWQEALDYVKTLNDTKHLGQVDWRLPNVNELASLVNIQTDLAWWLRTQEFRNLQVDYYWTSTTYASYAACAWSVGIYGGIVAGHDKSDHYFVWPVRRAEPGVIALPRTGQTACSDESGKAVACAGTGQDGESQDGVTWPSPRFIENTAGSLFDKLTGLVWSKDAMAPGPDVCLPGARKNQRDALKFVACLNVNSHLGKQDWRLPNRSELATLANRGQADSAAWLNTQGFSGVQPSSYWSSSSFVYNTWNGWSVNLHDGAVTTYAKPHAINVWPVRGGR